MLTLRRLITEEEGQNLIEYTLMIGLVVVIIWAAVNASGINTVVSKIWSTVQSSLGTVSS